MNHYQRLGVSQQADFETIQKAYHQLARQYHPDHNPQTADLFRQINVAYETLSDPENRQAYDHTLITLKPPPIKPIIYTPYRRPLQYIFDFRAEDLEYNQQGQLSPRQKTRLKQEYVDDGVSFGLMLGGLVALFIIFILFGFFEGINLAIASAVTIILPVILGGIISYQFLVWKGLPTFDDVTVSTLESRLVLRVKQEKRDKILYAELPDGSQQWNLDSERFDALEEDKIYRIYFIPQDHLSDFPYSRILAIKLITDSISE